MLDSRISAVILSRGSTWNPLPWQPPYLQSDPASAWPDGAAVQTVFYDTAGGVLATIDGVVEPDKITFNAPPSAVDGIPAGANFEIILTTGGAPYQIRYGKVIRKEPTFLQAPPTSIAAQPLKFVDSWPTLGLRSAWVPVSGATKVFDNSAAGLPNGIGPQGATGLLDVLIAFLESLVGGGGSASSIRWFEPLNSDSAKVNVTLLNRHSGSGVSRTAVVLCGDQSFTTWLAAVFGTDNTIGFAVGTGPGTAAFEGTQITNTVAGTPDNYTITYNDPTRTVSVYKGNNLTPLGSWTDAGEIVPHGMGYRYLGFAFSNAASDPGIQVTSWQAMDDV